MRPSGEDPALATVGALAAVTAVVGACGGGPQAAAENPTSEATATSAQAAPNTSSTASSANGVTQISDIFGPACDQVPKQGPGSAQGMANDPVATAASNNPLLTKLTAAIKAANLTDTLNSAPALTVFTPTDSRSSRWAS